MFSPKSSLIWTTLTPNFSAQTKKNLCGFTPSSIAMATKENITFQRGMLKSIQTRVTTLASILNVGICRPAATPFVLFLVGCSELRWCIFLAAKGNPTRVLIFFLHHSSPPIRSFPCHQQPHPENQFAQEAWLFNSRRGDRRLHHPPVALHFPLIGPVTD